MDKPLSQERLSEEDMRIAKLFQVPAHSFAFTFKYGPKLIAEIERLQAIEAERDRYKEAVDFCISTFQGNEMFIKAEQVKLMIKGAVNHE